MIEIVKFTFNPFQENSYLILGKNKSCIVIDPGCSDSHEETILKNYIEKNGLKPSRLLNTHCHLDHIAGNEFIRANYGLRLEAHRNEIATLNMAPMSAQLYGLGHMKTSPPIEVFIDEADQIEINGDFLDILFVPGHAPGHLAFVHHASKSVINGDVLFYGSIGRTDLPGGNHQQLLKSIEEKMFTLPDDYTIYCGHGPETTVGFEKKHNPFFN